MGARTLLLLRHAKSAWDNPRLRDFERPLAPRGRRAAPRMGRYLAEAGLTPDRVLCSPARRTVQTWELVEMTLDRAPPVSFETDLYHGSPTTMLELIREQPTEDAVLMIVAHNPGTEELALGLSGQGDPDTVERLRGKFPTAALAEIGFDVPRWDQVTWGSGELKRFVRPRDLTGS